MIKVVYKAALLWVLSRHFGFLLGWPLGLLWLGGTSQGAEVVAHQFQLLDEHEGVLHLVLGLRVDVHCFKVVPFDLDQLISLLLRSERVQEGLEFLCACQLLCQPLLGGAMGYLVAGLQFGYSLVYLGWVCFWVVCGWGASAVHENGSVSRRSVPILAFELYRKLRSPCKQVLDELLGV